LLTGSIKSAEITDFIKNADLSSPQVVWCPRESIQDLVSTLQPKVVISNNSLEENALSKFSEENIKLFFTGRDGAVQWTPNGKFESFIQTTENKSSVL
jgi:competence protein ComEC